MNDELQKARRELVRLKCCRTVVQMSIDAMEFRPWAYRRYLAAGRAMARDLAHQIARQELECRKCEMEQEGYQFTLDHLNWHWCYAPKGMCRTCQMSTLEKAVKWAERQNRKAGAKFSGRTLTLQPQLGTRDRNESTGGRNDRYMPQVWTQTPVVDLWPLP